MQQAPKRSVLARKTAGQEARKPSPRQALRRALSQISAAAFGEPVEIGPIARLRADQRATRDQIGDDGLMVTICNAAGQVGVAVLDLQLISGLVEAQTLGMLLSRPATDRPLTRTDAAIAMPIFDRLLASFHQELDQSGADEWQGPFHYGHFLTDKRALALALQAADFDLLQTHIDLGDGGRQGALLIALPRVVQARSQAKQDRAAAKKAFQQRIRGAEISLTAYLPNVPLSLDRLMSLKVGDCLALDHAVLENARLCSAASHAASVPVHLGHVEGRWVAKLRQRAEPGQGQEKRQGGTAAGHPSNHVAQDVGDLLAERTATKDQPPGMLKHGDVYQAPAADPATEAQSEADQADHQTGHQSGAPAPSDQAKTQGAVGPPLQRQAL